MHEMRIEKDSGFFSPLSEAEKEDMIRMLHKFYGQIAEELKKMGLDNYV